MKHPKLNRVTKVAYGIILMFLFFTAFITIVSGLKTELPVHVYAVKSGSMTPTISIGSLILAKKEPAYQKGDIITFTENSNETTTHRIIEIIKQNDSVSYRTKGDANKIPDSLIVTPEYIVGKVFASLPYAGIPILYAKTPIGFIALIIIPATLIIYTEVISVKNEIIRLIQKKKKK